MGFWGMWCSALDGYGYMCPTTGPDYLSHDDTFYFPWLLQQVAAYYAETGLLLIDYIDAHWYSYTLDDDTKPQDNAACLAQTRTLWDTTYDDINGNRNPLTGSRAVPLIPVLRSWLDEYAPGLDIGVAVTEWNYGLDSSNTVALAHAEVWSIFARFNVSLGCRFGGPAAPGTPAYSAIAMYRNYDGQGGTVSGDSVLAEMQQPAGQPTAPDVTVYAQHSACEQTLYVTIFNHEPDTAYHANISLINLTFTQPGGAEALSSQCWSFNACPSCVVDLAATTSSPLAVQPDGSVQAQVIVEALSATLCVYAGVNETNAAPVAPCVFTPDPITPGEFTSSTGVAPPAPLVCQSNPSGLPTYSAAYPAFNFTATPPTNAYGVDQTDVAATVAPITVNGATYPAGSWLWWGYSARRAHLLRLRSELGIPVLIQQLRQQRRSAGSQQVLRSRNQQLFLRDRSELHQRIRGGAARTALRGRRSRRSRPFKRGRSVLTSCTRAASWTAPTTCTASARPTCGSAPDLGASFTTVNSSTLWGPRYGYGLEMFTTSDGLDSIVLVGGERPS